MCHTACIARVLCSTSYSLPNAFVYTRERDLRSAVINLNANILAKLMTRRSSLRNDWSGSDMVIGLAESHGFVPLMADIGGVCGLMPDGSIVEMGWDDAAPRRVAKNSLRDQALLSAAARYPELRELIPSRLPDAAECPGCRGTGIPPLASSAPNLICYCGGLGWIPPDWDE